MTNGWFGGHGGNSIAITGSTNGGNGTLKGIEGNGGHSGPATSIACNGGNIYRNSGGTGSEGSTGVSSMPIFSTIP